MRNFFASLKSSHALRWLLIWGVVLLLVIVLIRYISERHAAASGITTSGSGLDMTGAGIDTSGGGGSGGSSTNINISITDALSQFFGRNKGSSGSPGNPGSPGSSGSIQPVARQGGVVTSSGSGPIGRVPPAIHPRPGVLPPTPQRVPPAYKPPVKAMPPTFQRTPPRRV